MPERTPRFDRLVVRLFAAIFAAVALLIGVTLLLDLHASGKSWSELTATPDEQRALASTVSRAFNQLISMVLAFIALAVPITANMYTPKLIEAFVKDKVNLAVLVSFVSLGAFAVYGQAVAFKQWTPTWTYGVMTVGGVVGFVLLLPYYVYVLGFLDPDRIIALVARRVTDELPAIMSERRPTAEAQLRFDERLRNLGNVILRAVDRADRDVAIRSIEALRDVLGTYQMTRSRLSAAWFDVPAGVFVGASDAALALIRTDRIWVEQRGMGQLLLAFRGALTRMPDAVSAISDVTRKSALNAAREGHEQVLRLALRYFNSYLRAAVRKQDVHAIYDVVYQYRELAAGLCRSHPQLAVEIGTHLRYYAEFAEQQRISFIHDLTGYDLAHLVECATDVQSPAAPQLLDHVLAHGGPSCAGRQAVPRALLAAYFAQRGDEASHARLIAALAHAPAEALDAAARRISTTTDAIFWEVTDRQTNFDYVPAARRALALEAIEAARTAQHAD